MGTTTRATATEQGVVVKKIIAALVAAAGFAVWRKVQSDKAEQALWAEVTDPAR